MTKYLDSRAEKLYRVVQKKINEFYVAELNGKSVSIEKQHQELGKAVIEHLSEEYIKLMYEAMV